MWTYMYKTRLESVCADYRMCHFKSQRYALNMCSMVSQILKMFGSEWERERERERDRQTDRETDRERVRVRENM